MKIISYNINSCNQNKVDQLFEQNADVYVVPEIACQDKIKIPDEYEMKWNSKYPTKGLGIIWRKGKGSFPEWYDDKLTYAIPLVFDNVLIIGFWPTKIDQNKTYTQIAKEIIEKYSEHFKDFEQCIITGDYNLYHKNDKSDKAADILEINKLLNSHGLTSVYHKQTGQDFGSETQKTYYHLRDINNPFFLDYTYSKKEIQKYELLPWDKDFSDHVCQVIEV